MQGGARSRETLVEMIGDALDAVRARSVNAFFKHPYTIKQFSHREAHLRRSINSSGIAKNPSALCLLCTYLLYGVFTICTSCT